MRLVLLWLAAATLADFPLVRTLELKGEVHHVQGIDFDETRLWATSVDRVAKKGYLHEFALPAGELQRTDRGRAGDRFHPGRHGARRRVAVDPGGGVPPREHRHRSRSGTPERSSWSCSSTWPTTSDVIAGGRMCWSAATGTAANFTCGTSRGQAAADGRQSDAEWLSGSEVCGRPVVGGGLLPGRVGGLDWLECPSLKPAAEDRGGPDQPRGPVYQ